MDSSSRQPWWPSMPPLLIEGLLLLVGITSLVNLIVNANTDSRLCTLEQWAEKAIGWQWPYEPEHLHVMQAESAKKKPSTSSKWGRTVKLGAGCGIGTAVLTIGALLLRLYLRRKESQPRDDGPLGEQGTS